MNFLRDHGTKLLGGLTTAVGVLGTVDPAVLNDALGQKGVSYLAGIAGILTILRGFQNTANQQQTPAPK